VDTLWVGKGCGIVEFVGWCIMGLVKPRTTGASSGCSICNAS